METVVVKDRTVTSWRRWFRRTNVYIAEYIIMLALVSGFIGILASLWFSFFDMLYLSYSTGALVASQIGALLIVGPAAFWMYSRVTGQEMVQPSLYASKARTVFLTIWLFFAVISLVGMVVTVASEFVNALFGITSDFGAALVTTVLPGLFAVATVAFGLSMVVKHTSRKFVMTAASVLAISAFVLLIANTTMVLVRKDTTPLNTQTTPFSQSQEDCTYTRYYIDNACSYDEYQDYMRSSSDSSSRYYSN